MRRSLGHLGEIDPDNWRNEPDFMLGPFWVGDFTYLQTMDYGSNEFHGRFHPAIPWVAMRRFTKPGDVVWDCFAGSGTTVDVGEELERLVIASDLHPTRSDIENHDASEWHPNVAVDLGIMHPPYMGIIDYDSPMSDVSTVSAFVVKFDACLYNMDLVLKPGHVLVLVIGEIWLDGELQPLEYVLDRLLRESYGYRLIGRIVKDFGRHTKGGVLTSGKSTNLWKYRLLKWGYFRNGIDTILFYQRQ